MVVNFEDVKHEGLEREVRLGAITLPAAGNDVSFDVPSRISQPIYAVKDIWLTVLGSLEAVAVLLFGLQAADKTRLLG